MTQPTKTVEVKYVEDSKTTPPSKFVRDAIAAKATELRKKIQKSEE